MDKPLSQYHDEIIRAMQEHPDVPPVEIAKMFGMSQHWLELMMSSDMFQSRLMAANKKGEGENSVETKSVAEKTEAVASLGIDIIAERFENGRHSIGTLPTDEVAALTFAAMKMNGYGPQPKTNGITIDNRKVEVIVDATVLSDARALMIAREGATVEHPALPAPSTVDAG